MVRHYGANLHDPETTKEGLVPPVTPPQSPVTANQENTPLSQRHLRDVTNCSYENEATGP